MKYFKNSLYIRGMPDAHNRSTWGMFIS